jgi:hypothetical protein
MDGSPLKVAVRPFRDGDERGWDEFVLGRENGTFFHLAGWKRIIEQVFGHRTYYLIAERAGAVTGVLPMTLVKSLLFGSSLISNAFAVRGGPLADNLESRHALESEAVRLMETTAVPVLELRDYSPNRVDWQTRSNLYFNFRRPLAQSVDENLKVIPRKQRAMIRKGMRNQLKSEMDDDVGRL